MEYVPTQDRDDVLNGILLWFRMEDQLGRSQRDPPPQKTPQSEEGSKQDEQH